MITIEDPPIATACAGCQRPLVWVYSARTGKWVAVVPDGGQADIMRVHRCRDGIPQPSWRDTPPAGDPAERARRGRALVDAALAEARTDHQPENGSEPDA